MAHSVHKIQLKILAINLLVFLIAYLPFVAVVQNIIPQAGWLKDILCIIILVCTLSHGRVKINTALICVLIYSMVVTISIATSDSLSLANKLDAFRYRCEYPITLALLFSSYSYSKNELAAIAERIIKTIYITGVIVALIGCVELVNPTLVHSIYGSSLTTHLSVWTGGINQSARLISTMGNPINLGFQMTLAMGSALFLFHEKNDKAFYKKAFYLFSIVMFVLVTVYTYSRSAYFMMIAVVVAFYIVQIFISRTTIGRKITFLASIFIGIAVVLVLINQIESLAYRIAGMTLEGFVRNTRFSRAAEAFSNDWNNFFYVIFGCGIGKRLGSSGQYLFEFGYASLLFESGIAGILVFFILICKSIIVGCNTINKYQSTIRANTIYLCYVVAFLCGMLVEDLYFQSPYNLFVWISFLSLILSQNTSQREEYGKLIEN